MKEQKTLYANSVNLGGLYSPLPIAVTFDPETNAYWSNDGNFDIPKIGTTHFEGRVTFASDKMSEAVAWTIGAKAVMHILHRRSRP